MPSIIHRLRICYAKCHYNYIESIKHIDSIPIIGLQWFPNTVDKLFNGFSELNQPWLIISARSNYSETSDKGHSLLRTQYKKPLL